MKSDRARTAARDAGTLLGCALILAGCWRISGALCLLIAGAIVLAICLPGKKVRR